MTIHHHECMMIWQSNIIGIRWYDNPSSWGYDDMTIYEIKLQWFDHWWDMLILPWSISDHWQWRDIWFDLNIYQNDTIWRWSYADAIMELSLLVMLWPGLQPHRKQDEKCGHLKCARPKIDINSTQAIVHLDNLCYVASV